MAYEITTIGDLSPAPAPTEIVVQFVRDQQRGLVAGVVLGVVLGAIVFRKRK